MPTTTELPRAGKQVNSAPLEACWWDFVSLFLFCAFLIVDAARKRKGKVCGSRAFLGMLGCTDYQQAADGRKEVFCLASGKTVCTWTTNGTKC